MLRDDQKGVPAACREVPDHETSGGPHEPAHLGILLDTTRALVLNLQLERLLEGLVQDYAEKRQQHLPVGEALQAKFD